MSAGKMLSKPWPVEVFPVSGVHLSVDCFARDALGFEKRLTARQSRLQNIANRPLDFAFSLQIFIKNIVVQMQLFQVRLYLGRSD